jgi:hypothetical protein
MLLYSGQKQGHRASHQQEIRQENKAKTQKVSSKYTNGLLPAEDPAYVSSLVLSKYQKERIRKGKF